MQRLRLQHHRAEDHLRPPAGQGKRDSPQNGQRGNRVLPTLWFQTPDPQDQESADLLFGNFVLVIGGGGGGIVCLCIRLFAFNW